MVKLSTIVYGISIYRSRDWIAVIAATVATVSAFVVHHQCGWSLELKVEMGENNLNSKPFPMTKITADTIYMFLYWCCGVF